MATRTFTDGAGDGDLTNASNWDGATPTGGDSVIFNGYSRTITVGLGSVALASLIVTSSNASTFSAPITTGTITSLLFMGSGNYSRWSGSVTTGVIDIARARTFYIDGGTWGGTEIRCAKGTVQVAAAAVLTNIYNGSGDWTVYANATEIPVLRNTNGKIICDGRSVSDYIGLAGSSLSLRNAALIEDGASGGIAVVGNGGTLNLEGATGTSDKIISAGTVNARNAKGVQTITDLYPLPGHMLNDSSSFPTVVSNNHPFTGASSGAGTPILN